MLDLDKLSLKELQARLDRLNTKIADNSWHMSEQILSQMYDMRETIQEEIFYRSEVKTVDKNQPKSIFSDPDAEQPEE